MNRERIDWKPSEQELLDYASQEELFLFADEADYLAIANGVLELVQIRMDKSALQAKSVPEDYANIFAEVNVLCQLICNSPPETTIKGEIVSRAFMLGHFPDILNAAPQRADKALYHYEYIVVDPTEESDAGVWPVLVPNGYKVVPVIEADKVQELEAKYNELILAVVSKYPNETRHQTALRYINDAEFRAEKDNKPVGALKDE